MDALGLETCSHRTHTTMKRPCDCLQFHHLNIMLLHTFAPKIQQAASKHFCLFYIYIKYYTYNHTYCFTLYSYGEGPQRPKSGPEDNSIIFRGNYFVLHPSR